jgi:hypothetical protein
MLLSFVSPNIAGYQGPDPAPIRRAEYALTDRLAASVLMGAILFLAAMTGLLWLTSRKTAGKGIFLFIGWRPLARVLMLSIVLPLAIYALYAYLLPISSHHIGVQIGFSFLLLEYSRVAIAVLVSLNYLARSAILNRASQLALAGPAFPPAVTRATLRRSRISIFAAAALLVGIIGGAALYSIERTATRRSDITSLLPREIESSNFRFVKENLTTQHAHWLAAHSVASPGTPKI